MCRTMLQQWCCGCIDWKIKRGALLMQCVLLIVSEKKQRKAVNFS